MYRNTYVKVYLDHIKRNVETMIQTFPDYQYYFAVVKADCYGHYGERPIQKMIEAGCNYLAVSSLDEAMAVRKQFPSIPILCLEPIAVSDIEVAFSNHITLTICSLEEADEISHCPYKGKVHLKVNTGMNRLGFSSKEDLQAVYQILKKSKTIEIEGIYTHIYDAMNEEKTKKQFTRFEESTSMLPLSDIPIVHVTASEATERYPKLPFVNGCRFGIMMYGFTTSDQLQLESTFTVESEVLQIQQLHLHETVGYDGIYEAKEEGELIAVVAIGYADGIIRANRGRSVYIHGRPYPIVGNICMDMLFVRVDESVQVHDLVQVIKDKEHILEIAHMLHTVPHEVLTSISKRVPRIYIESKK